MLDIERILRAYIICALSLSCDLDTDKPLDDDHDSDDLTDECRARMLDDVSDFCQANAALLDGLDAEQVGHDFWLTRNKHGAGFWDRGLGEQGQKLTEAAHGYGSADIYAHDGKIHHY